MSGETGLSFFLKHQSFHLKKNIFSSLHPMHPAHGQSVRAREFFSGGKFHHLSRRKRKQEETQRCRLCLMILFLFFLPIRQHNTYSRGWRAHATKQQGECRFLVQLVHAVRRVNESSEGDPREATWDWHFSGGSPSLYFGKKNSRLFESTWFGRSNPRQIVSPGNRVAQRERLPRRALPRPSGGKQELCEVRVRDIQCRGEYRGVL